MLLFKYVALHYLKYFSVILSALVLFYVGFDYMGVASSLPSSANLVILYLIYKAQSALDIMLPLALLFSMISTKLFLIRSNALVAFYSLGYSKHDLLKPFLIVSVSIVFFFITLHATSFAKANEISEKVKKNAQYVDISNDLFFTYKNKYIYFERLEVLQRTAYNVRIFKLENETLSELIIASSAVYRGEYWEIDSAHVIKKPAVINLDSHGIEVNSVGNLKILRDFRPKILDQIYEGKVNFSILDAVEALSILNDENLNIDLIKSSLYKAFIYPFFVPLMIIIIFYMVPISPRFLNVTLFSFGAILASLLVWGVLFMLIELSNTKTIPSEIGIILPIFILILGAIFQWKRFK